MPDLESALVARLTADGGVSAIVGARVQPLEEGLRATRPFLSYQVTANEPLMSYSGPTSFSEAQAEIGIVADSFADCVALANAVKTCLIGSWIAPPAPAAGMQAVPCELEEESDIGQTLEPGTNQKVFVRTQSYRILARIAGT
jgi:hypothetical protein